MANFHVDSSGNLWLGNTSTTFSTSAPFYVTSAGAVRATSGDIGGITLASDHMKSTNYSNTSGSEAGFKIDSNGDAFFNKVDIRIGGAASQNPSTGFTTLDIGSAKLSEYNDDLWVNAKRVLIFDQDATASANSPSLFLFAAYGQPGWYVDDSQIGRTKLYYSNGVNNVFHTESDNTYLHLDGSGIQVGTATGGNSQYIGKNSSGTFGWHNLPSGSGGSHSDSDHTSFYSQSAGEALASSISSHTGHATSLSLLSNTSSDDSAGLFVTSVSGLGIRRTNRAGTTLFSQHLYPKNSHSSWGGIYDIGASPVQAYDDAYIGTVNENSDVNIKENIVDVDLGLDFINALTPKKYKLKDFDYENDEGETVSKTHTRTHYGLIAQDVKEVLKSIHPDDYTNDAMFTHLPNDDGEFVGEDSEFDGWALRYRQLIAPLVKAVQELSTQVSDLTARIEALEG